MLPLNKKGFISPSKGRSKPLEELFPVATLKKNGLMPERLFISRLTNPDYNAKIFRFKTTKGGFDALFAFGNSNNRGFCSINMGVTTGKENGRPISLWINHIHKGITVISACAYYDPYEDSNYIELEIYNRLYGSGHLLDLSTHTSGADIISVSAYDPNRHSNYINGQIN